MADNTKIEWTEATWNPITGCSLASPGCTNCYAMQLAGTRLAHHESRAGLTREVNGNHVWTGEVRFNEQWLDQPLRWTKPRMIFVCAHGDLFHESVPDAWIDRIFAVMALCPQHTFQVLTKRSARMREYLSNPLRAGIVQTVVDNWECEDDCPFGDAQAPWVIDPWPLPNVWLGVSVEDQQRADERIPDLLATATAIRWISAEPLLGPVNITDAMWSREDRLLEDMAATIDWVVVGGESGSKARPMHPDWARSLRDQCTATDTPFFFKQWGEWCSPTVEIVDARGTLFHCFLDGQLMERLGKKRAGRLLDGIEHNGMPQ